MIINFNWETIFKYLKTIVKNNINSKILKWIQIHIFLMQMIVSLEQEWPLLSTNLPSHWALNTANANTFLGPGSKWFQLYGLKFSAPFQFLILLEINNSLHKIFFNEEIDTH